MLLRIEDLDAPRVVRGATERILEDLAWLGITWDEGPVHQSTRFDHYATAVERLATRGLVYPCDCSRAEIARVASAPHPGEETVYPGTCRDKDPARAFKRPPARRLRVQDTRIELDDLVMGRYAQRLADVGDFVLKRGDGLYAYQLAVAIDDMEMGITHVLRGADLLSSTPRQIHLIQLLGGRVPEYGHIPLVVASDGSRLAKRTPGASVRDLK